MENSCLSIVNGIKLQSKFDVVDESYPSIMMHHHNAYEVTLFLRSENWLFVKDKRYRLDANKLVFIAPYTPHTLQYTHGTEYHRIILNFEAAFIESLLQVCGYMEVLTFFQLGPTYGNAAVIDLSMSSVTKVSRMMGELCHAFSASGAARDKYSRARIQLALTSFLISLYEVSGSRGGETTNVIRSDMVKKIVRYIDEHFSEPITLKMMEQECYVSRYYLSRIFKSFTGMSIIEYLQHRRILKAQQMLMESELTTTEICYQCGFNNIQHFYRVFKKNTGITPGIWIRSRTLNVE